MCRISVTVRAPNDIAWKPLWNIRFAVISRLVWPIHMPYTLLLLQSSQDPHHSLTTSRHLYFLCSEEMALARKPTLELALLTLILKISHPKKIRLTGNPIQSICTNIWRTSVGLTFIFGMLKEKNPETGSCRTISPYKIVAAESEQVSGIRAEETALGATWTEPDWTKEVFLTLLKVILLPLKLISLSQQLCLQPDTAVPAVTYRKSYLLSFTFYRWHPSVEDRRLRQKDTFNHSRNPVQTVRVRY